jgi:flagellar basal-body rod modification protein FlgD
MTAVSSNNSFQTPSASSTAANTSTNTTSNPTAPGSITNQKSLDSTFSDFLTLLTTQLKNQDPTSPMDTAQFTNQLVSFSQVEQQLKSNADLDKLVTAANNNQTQLGLSYMGLDVSVQGNQFSFNPATQSAVTVGYTLPAAATSNKISVLDSNSNVVYTTTGSLNKGSNTFTWNGKETNGTTAPAGNYTVQVSAMDATNTPIAATTLVPGQVTGMQTASDGTVQLVINNSQVVPLSSIESATLPPARQTASSTTTGSGS